MFIPLVSKYDFSDREQSLLLMAGNAPQWLILGDSWK